MVSDIDVRDNPARHRLELFVDGELSGLADCRERDDVVVVTHSEVDPGLRGEGLGNVLAQRTLDHFRERGVKVLPACPFFAHYVAGHPEYDNMIVE